MNSKHHVNEGKYIVVTIKMNVVRSLKRARLRCVIEKQHKKQNNGGVSVI